MKILKKTVSSKIKKENRKDLSLDFALKTLGYLMPITDEELKSFNEINGDTVVDLPSHLEEAKFLNHDRVHKTNPIASIDANEKQAKKPNDFFKKIILAAEIANELHSEPTFGHVKFVKIYCLCNEIGKMKLSTRFGKYAAGPLDPKLMYTIDNEFKNRKWFKVVKSSHGFKYFPDEDVDEYKKYYCRYFKYEIEIIARIINLLRREKTAFCEQVATLFIVWKEALSENEIISEKLLFSRFYEWDKEKSKFAESELKLAFNWMVENSIVPVK